MRKYVYAAVAALVLLPAAAAYAGPPFDVDDTETPEKGHFELNVGYISSQEQGGEEQEFPNFDFSYGYLDNVELGIVTGAISVREAGGPRVVGLADTEASVKWRFLEETKRRPQVALQYAMKIPVASRARGLGSGEFDHTLQALAQKSFGPTTVGLQLGRNLFGDSETKDCWAYGLLVTRQLSEKLVLGAELYGNSKTADDEHDDLAWGVGFTYTFAPDRAFLFKAGRSVHGFSDLDLYAGVQLSFK